MSTERKYKRALNARGIFLPFFLSNVPKWTFVVQIASFRSSFQDMKVIALSGFIATSIPDIKVFYLCFPNIIFIFTGFLFFMEKIKNYAKLSLCTIWYASDLVDEMSLHVCNESLSAEAYTFFSY